MALVQVDGSGEIRGSEISYYSSGSPPHAGPYVGASGLYILGFNQYDPTNTYIRIFKSTDDGATYAEADAMDAPIAHNRLVALSQNEWRHYDSVLVGTRIYIVYAQTDDTLAITWFETATDQWGTVWTGGPTITAESVFYITYDPVATQFTMAYQLGVGGPNDIKYRFVSAVGVWGSENTLIVASGGLLLDALVSGYDGTNFWSVCIYRLSIVDGYDLRSISLTAGGTLGTSQLIDSRTDISHLGVNVYVGLPMGANSLNGFTMMVTASWDTGDIGTDLTKTLKSYTATPTLNPVWAALTIESSVSVGVYFLGSSVAAGSDGNVYIIYYNRLSTVYYYRTYSGGVWSTATVLNDLNFDAFQQNQTSIATGHAYAVGVIMIYGDAGDGTSFSDTVNPEGFVTYIYKNNVFTDGIGVGGQPLEITCDNPPEGVVGVAYSHFFPATGGTPPYTFAIFAGALPDGLTLDTATGEVSGTPTLVGTFGFTISVTDGIDTDFIECTITIAAALEIECDSPPSGTVGLAYSHFFPATGGIPPYTFAITAGALPNGLTLDTATGEVSGNPILAGLFAFTIQVTDDDGNTDDIECSISISSGGGGGGGGGDTSFGSGGDGGNMNNSCIECVPGAPALFTGYLARERQLQSKVCSEDMLLSMTQPTPAVRLPPGWRQIFPNASVALAALTVGTEATVLSYTVPTGYDCYVQQLLNRYIAGSGGFVNESGDIIWRLRLGKTFVPNYGAIQSQLGDTETPWGKEGLSILGESTRTFTYSVLIVSAASLAPGARIQCGLWGVLKPKRPSYAATLFARKN